MVRMAEILREAGLTIQVGRYSIRVKDCDHFVFQEYGVDLGDPQIDADADSPEEMIRDGGLVSGALARAGIRHQFEIYDDDGEDRYAIVRYLHYGWPMSPGRDS